jgi:hypothetical protein
MREKGLNVLGLEDILGVANDKLVARRNQESYSYSTEIINAKETAEKVNNLLFSVVNALLEPRKTYMLVGNAVFEIDNPGLEALLTSEGAFANKEISNLLQLAYAAYTRGDYETALERVENARELLILDRKANPLIFVYLYWPYIIIALVLLGFFSVWFYRKRKVARIRQKIVDLGEEGKELQKKFVGAQRVYFGGKMSQSDYQRLVKRTNGRMATIAKQRVKLRNKRVRLFNKDEIVKDLDKEKHQIEGEVRNIQIKFYKNKKIGASEYDFQFKALNARLAEIENERITIKLGKKKIKHGK